MIQMPGFQAHNLTDHPEMIVQGGGGLISASSISGGGGSAAVHGNNANGNNLLIYGVGPQGTHSHTPVARI